MVPAHTIDASLGRGLARRHQREGRAAFAARMAALADEAGRGCRRNGPMYRKLATGLRSVWRDSLVLDIEGPRGAFLAALEPDLDSASRALRIAYSFLERKRPRRFDVDYLGVITEHARARMHQRRNETTADYAAELAPAVRLMVRDTLTANAAPLADGAAFELPTVHGALLGVVDVDGGVGYVARTWVHADQLDARQHARLAVLRAEAGALEFAT